MMIEIELNSPNSNMLSATIRNAVIVTGQLRSAQILVA